MTEELREDKAGFGTHILVCIIYAILIAAFYSPVIFGGKSLNPTLYQPHGVTARGVYGVKGRTPVNSFNVDLATPAFYEFPVNKLVGDMYREGHIPLWDPYQAAGTPLAAQYSTRAFFPYQIIEDLAPVKTWDYFILGRLLIAGFFTYLFISALGAGPWSAFAGGLFYMFSGVFTWFVNLEQLANTAMMVPILLLSLEMLARGAPRARWVKTGIVVSAFCFAFTLLAGQPETTLYVLTLALLYYLLRAFSIHGLKRGLMTVPRIAISFITGLALSSPLILIFVELAGKGAHIHHAGGSMGTESLLNWRALFNILTPTLSYFPADPATIKGTSLMAQIGTGWFRFLPINGVWDNIGGYTGVLPLFLIISGIFLCALRKKIPLRKFFLFFILITAFMILKNAGIWPFMLIGKAPMFDRVWTLRWASPVWVFSASVAAAIGLALIESHLAYSAEKGKSEDKSFSIPPGVAFILATGIIGGGYIIFSFLPSMSIFLHSADVFNNAMRPYVFPSIISGSIVTLLVIGTAFSLTYFWKDEKNVYALIILAIVELWWCVPRGYAPETLNMKWVPLGVGLLAVSFFFRNKIAYTLMAIVVFFGAAFLMDSIAPNGYPPLDDAFRTSPYVSAVLKDSQGQRPRVAGAYGALFPNYAGVVKLDDVRYVNSVTPMEFQSFREKYLHSRSTGELKEMSLWFSGRPERIGDENVEGRHVYSKIVSPPENDFLAKERGYSLLGVKYFIFPGKRTPLNADESLRETFAEKFPLFYDKADARVYKNPYALPRVFLASNTLKAPSWQAAQKAFIEGDFDPSQTIVLEDDVQPEKASDDREERGGGSSSAKTSSRGPLRGAAASLYGYIQMALPASAEAASEAVQAKPYITAPGGTGAEKAEKAAPETHPEAVLDLTTKDGPVEAISGKAHEDGSEKTIKEVAPNKAHGAEEAGTGSATDTTEATAPEGTVPEPAEDKSDAKISNGPTEVLPAPLTLSPAEKAPEATEEEPAKESSDIAKSEKPQEAVSEKLPNEAIEAAIERALDEHGAAIREYLPAKVTVDVRADKAGVLVLSDIYYPGWKVKVNGEKAKVLRVNGLLRGVSVKEGRSSVVFYYMPLNFILGLVFMSLAGIFCIFLIFKDIKD